MYETEVNLRDEDRITRRVAAQYGGTFRKVTQPYRIDGVLDEDGRVTAFLEAKRRSHPSTRYSSLMISLLKWETGILHTQTTGLPFYIAIEFTDRLMVYKYSPDHQVIVQWGGRTRDPRDRADIEPVVHIPIELFSSLD